MQSSSHFPALYSFISSFQNTKEDIVTHWLQEEKIIAIFALHKVSLEKFRRDFAPYIVEYFIDILRGKQLIGDCPIMSKFLHYMITKHLMPHEVYDICTRLRKVLLLYVLRLEEERGGGATKELVAELSSLFDANLSGVLRVYTDYFAKESQSLAKASEYQKKFHVMTEVLDGINAKIFLVQSGRILFCNAPLLKILGVVNVADLYHKYRDGFSFFHDVSFETELFDKKLFDLWIQKLSQNNTTIQVTLFNAQLRDSVEYNLVLKALKSEPERYLFTLQEHDWSSGTKEEDFLQIKDRLTGFHSYAYYKKLVAKHKKNENFSYSALALVSMNALRYVNETQGLESGDRLILDVASKLKEMAEESMVIARADGSHFVILFTLKSMQHIYDWCVQLRYRLIKIHQNNTLALSAIDSLKNINKTELRAYELLESLQTKAQNYVVTDISEVDAYDMLDDQAMFIDQFAKMQELNEGALLFQELVIKAKNKIVKIADQKLFILVSSKQLLVARRGNSFYIHTQTMGYIHAKIESIDLQKSVVALSHFAYDAHTPLKRKMVRVSVDATFFAELIDDSALESEVISLNEEYIAFILPRKKMLKIAKMIHLELHIKEDYLEMSGSVYKIEKLVNGYKCVVNLHHTTTTKEKINAYIAQRQIQIIQELNGLL